MAELKFTPLKSSNIESYHYDEDTQTLTVRFKSGGQYAYGGVARDHADGLSQAESAGKYFHQHIKGGGYKFTKG